MQGCEIRRSRRVQRPSSAAVLCRRLVMPTAGLFPIQYWCQSQQHAGNAARMSSLLLLDSFNVAA